MAAFGGIAPLDECTDFVGGFAGAGGEGPCSLLPSEEPEGTLAGGFGSPS